jgi:hypothetical protein
MCGAIYPLPQYAFVAWCSVKSKWTTLPLPLSYCSSEIIEYRSKFPYVAAELVLYFFNGLQYQQRIDIHKEEIVVLRSFLSMANVDLEFSASRMTERI